MKKTLLALLFIVVSLAGSAQNVSYSTTFPRLKGLFWKLFQCTNGNTFFFNYVNGEGMFVTLYDTAHQSKSTKAIPGRGWDAKDLEKMQVVGVYEINGDVVMFIQQEVEKVPCLFRVIIDAQTAMVKDNRKIAAHTKYARWETYALSMGGYPKSFHVVKDAYSSAYAVAAYDNLAPSPGKSPIVLTHYDGHHNAISKASFRMSSEDDYKFLRYVGMVVDTTSNVYLCTYAFDTRASGGKRSMMFFSKLTPGDTLITHQPLELTEDFKTTEAALRYHKKSGAVDMLLLTLTETKGKFGTNKITNYYNVWLASVATPTLKVNYFRPLSIGKIDEYNRAKFNAKDSYSGLPQNFIVHDDHSATVSFEQANPSRGGAVMLINDLAVLNLSPTGEEANGYVTKKVQSWYSGSGSFKQFEREQLFSSRAVSNNEYVSYDLINTPEAQYVIYNDRKENFSLKPDEELEIVENEKDIQAICQKLKDGSAQKVALFEEAGKGYEDRFAYIYSSHYLPSSRTYAVVLIERYKPREWKSRIAWVRFD
jgi:hypothetical protein